MNILNLSALVDDTEFQSRPVLIGPREEIQSRLAVFPSTLKRIRAAYWFAARAGLSQSEWIAEAFLRAALTEFCSVEEILKEEVASPRPYSSVGSDDPLLHFLKLLRNLNVHVTSLPVSPHGIEVQFGETSGQWQTFIITNLNAAELKSLKTGRHYTLADLEAVTAWFNVKQLHWGAGDVIQVGLNYLVHEIMKHHAL